MLPIVTGEAAHAQGAEGIERAKTWLEATMRASVPFTAPSAGQKLEFSWLGKGTFSFDMRGYFLADGLAGMQFLAEVKNYRNVGNQGAEFDDFLRKVYRVVCADPGKADEFDRFLWITWNPFRAKDWDQLCSPDAVHDRVKESAPKATSDGGEPVRQICEVVSERIWVIVMSTGVESLVPTDTQRWLAQASPALIAGAQG